MIKKEKKESLLYKALNNLNKTTTNDALSLLLRRKKRVIKQLQLILYLVNIIRNERKKVN